MSSAPLQPSMCDMLPWLDWRTCAACVHVLQTNEANAHDGHVCGCFGRGCPRPLSAYGQPEQKCSGLHDECCTFRGGSREYPSLHETGKSSDCRTRDCRQGQGKVACHATVVHDAHGGRDPSPGVASFLPSFKETECAFPNGCMIRAQ